MAGGALAPRLRPAAVARRAGFTDLGEELALPRILMLWPWFVLGLRLRPAHLRPLRNRTARRWALPVMAAAAAGAWWAAPRIDPDWLLMEAGADGLGVPPLLYVEVRLAQFAVGALLVAAFLALVPARRTAFTALGGCALYPLLLHGLALTAFADAGGYRAVTEAGPLAVLGTSVLVAGVTVLLSFPHVRRGGCCGRAWSPRSPAGCAAPPCRPKREPAGPRADAGRRTAEPRPPSAGAAVRSSVRPFAGLSTVGVRPPPGPPGCGNGCGPRHPSDCSRTGPG
ncbi:hypothetical protein ACWV95_15225 [Streptomyces albus]